jgi:hypothetical protein
LRGLFSLLGLIISGQFGDRAAALKKGVYLIANSLLALFSGFSVVIRRFVFVGFFL